MKPTPSQDAGQHGMNLATTAALWPTPQTDSFRNRGGERREDGSPDPRDIAAGRHACETVRTLTPGQFKTKARLTCDDLCGPIASQDQVGASGMD